MLVDMPLAQLKSYFGKNPKPSDFVAYWSAALEEKHNVKADIQIKKADFLSSFANCFHLWFTGTKGARIYAKLLMPKTNAAKRPAVLFYHGYAASSGDWYDKLGFVAEGFVVAAMDCRGQGGKSQDAGWVQGTTCRGHIVRGLGGRPENMLFRDIFLDTALLASIVMGLDEVDARNVSTFGMSQGAALALACAALEPGIAKVACANPFLCDYYRNWELRMGTRAYSELQEYFRFHDPLHERADQVFEQLGYIDVQHLADRIKAEVLMAVSMEDNVCSPSSQFSVYNKIQSSKQMLTYQDFSHELLPGFFDKAFHFFGKPLLNS